MLAFGSQFRGYRLKVREASAFYTSSKAAKFIIIKIDIRARV